MSNIRKSIVGLSLGALGVVFGDIGTSPLYAFSVIFGKTGHHLAVNQTNIFGIISLVIWSVTIVVSIKYIGFIMRADNHSEGGIMALVANIKSSKLASKYKWGFLTLGIVGVALFYGDSTITPAISVLSAVEGVKVITPSLNSIIIPVTIAILTILFAIQRYGTGIIGKLFGPIMFLWFSVIGLGGALQVWKHPKILMALSPWTALHYFVSHPLLAFVSMTAVVLAITGAEALYADMGHFGRSAIARAWFFVVFPALALCYMGEGALVLHNSGATANPLVLLFPSALRIPFIILATLATIIASQSVISGAFSLTRQAVQLDFLPKLMIRHTSSQEGGQIYLPFVNSLLFIAVVVLVIAFGSSVRLANAYGIAVSGALATDTILFLCIMRSVWHKPKYKIVITAFAFVPIDILFVSSNAPKVLRGGWFPIVIGVLVFVLIRTWVKGQLIVVKEKRAMEGSLREFVDQIHNHQPPISRVPGTAVYIGPHHDLAPLALRETCDEMHELHEKVVIVSISQTTASHIPENERATFDNLGYNDGISHVNLSYGFHDTINIPEALQKIDNLSPELMLDVSKASYFISHSRVVPNNRHNLSRWRKHLYCFMSGNALSSSDYYNLPIGRTIEMQTLIKL
jgi:KUP system potassium uptake protein